MGRDLDRWVRGEVRRLMVLVPFRHTKSEFVSRRLPAYIFGRDPDASIMHICHTARLSQRMSRDVKRVMDSPSYVELFPGTFHADSPHAQKVPGRWVDSDELWEIPGHRGVYRAAGAGQAVAGEGATHLIIDDPIKGRQQAYSKTERDKIHESYLNDLYTRLDSDDARILLTVTRWHDDDLVGRLLADMEKGGEKWEVLTLRAEKEIGDTDGGATKPDGSPIREVGELLWEARLGRERAEVMKRNAPMWASLAQQHPTPESGLIFQPNWLERRWVEWPSPKRSRWLFSWDSSFKNLADSSYVVGELWAKDTLSSHEGLGGAYYYLIDQVRAQLDFPDTIDLMLAFHARYPWAREAICEDKANGTAIMSALRKRGINLIPIEPMGSKVERAQAVAPLFAAGSVLMPPDDRAPWFGEYKLEMTRFPGHATDDQVDTTTQAINYLEGASKKNNEFPWKPAGR